MKDLSPQTNPAQCSETSMDVRGTGSQLALGQGNGLPLALDTALSSLSPAPPN